MATNIAGISTPAQVYANNVAAMKGFEIEQPASSSGSFAQIFNGLVQQADEQYNAANEGTQSLLSGETDNLAQVMIDSAKAESSLNMLIQIRNKVLDAYNEVMRMSL